VALISIYKPTIVTQTIVGDVSGPHIGWDNPGGSDEQIAVWRSNADIGNGFVGQVTARGVRFSLPVSIPPFHKAGT
jgi:hypothetical protein